MSLPDVLTDLEYRGELPRLILPWLSLAWAPALALGGALLGLLAPAPSPMGAPGAPAPLTRGARAWLLAPAVGLLLALLPLVVALAALTSYSGGSTEQGRALAYSPGFPLLRIGTLDARLDFVADAWTLGLALALVVGGAVPSLRLALLALRASRAASLAASTGDPTPSRLAAWVAWGTGSALAVLLGDSVVGALLGWEGLGLACLFGWAAVPLASPRASVGRSSFLLHRLGDLPFVAALGLLLWGLGGTWTEEGYFPEVQPRFVALVGSAPGANGASLGGLDTKESTPAPVSSTLAPRASQDSLSKVAERLGARGSVTMTSFPGSKVYLGVYEGAQLQGAHPPPPLGVSPFVRLPVPPGRVSLAIVPPPGVVVGGGFEAALLRNVTVEPDGETRIAPLGPTSSFEELQVQSRGRLDEGGTLLGRLRARPLLGVSTGSWLCLLLTLAWLAKASPLLLHAWSPAHLPRWPTAVVALQVATWGLPSLLLLHRTYASFPPSATLRWALSFFACALGVALWRKQQAPSPAGQGAPSSGLADARGQGVSAVSRALGALIFLLALGLLPWAGS